MGLCILYFLNFLLSCLRVAICESWRVPSSRCGAGRRNPLYYLPEYLDRRVNICSFFIIRLFTDYFYLLTSCETAHWTAPLGDALRQPGCDWHDVY